MPPSRLIGSPPAGAVADASVLVNLLASGYAVEVIRSTHQGLVVARQAYNEVVVGERQSARSDLQRAESLVEAKLLKVVDLPAPALEVLRF